jgi:hypothetical protein
MPVFSILEPFFHALNDGKLIRLTVAWVLRILAGLMVLLGLFCFLYFIRLGFRISDSGLNTRSSGILIGCVLFALFALAWGYVTAGILAFRARSITELEDSHFTVLSILSLLFRLNGELAFVTYSLLGVAGCLFVWLTDFSPLSELGMLGERLPFAEVGSSSFLSGIEFAVFMLLIAFGSIIFMYALAELTVVSVEIALNTRGLRAIPTATGPAPAPAAGIAPAALPPPPHPAPVENALRRSAQCGHCGQSLDPGATFCGECGKSVG